ncbi:MAG: CoA-binding protein [Anaerolineales bacterium]|jgi:predicted CoA-binding protein
MIKKILKETKTIAVVGISSKDDRPGFTVPAYLQSHGYRIIPVNPNLDKRLGEKAYPNLDSIPDPVDLVLLFRRSEAVPPFVEEAIQIGAKAVWMQLGVIHKPAAKKAREAGLDVVMDKCIAIEHRRLTNRQADVYSSSHR